MSERYPKNKAWTSPFDGEYMLIVNLHGVFAHTYLYYFPLSLYTVRRCTQNVQYETQLYS